MRSSKKTGEWELFLEIWEERDHKCEECRTPLGFIPLPVFFSHHLSKGAAPSLRLLKINIDLLCFKCHQKWEFGDKKSMNIYNEERYFKLKRLENER